MPNRILREGILSSDRVDQLDWPAECFYRRLMSVVDDFGRFDGRLQIILAACYPLKLGHVREADLQRWIAACVKAGLVRPYSANGKQFLQLEDFNQQIRAVKSKYPDPCTADATQMISKCAASAHLDGDVSVSVVVSELAGKPPKKKAERTDAQNNTVMSIWMEEYKKAQHSNYMIVKQDYPIIKQLGEQFPDRARLRQLFKGYLSDPSQYVAGDCWPLFKIAARINKYLKQIAFSEGKANDISEDDDSGRLETSA